jgi:protein gp37
LRKQCKQADVPFHFKQWGDWAPDQEANLAATGKTAQEAQDGTLMFRLGKKAAGRLLDGKTWDGLPTNKAA